MNTDAKGASDVTEEELHGGNSTDVRRVGATVRRKSGPWTTQVHELLRTVRAAGVTEVPEPLGIDEMGREVLSYLAGDVAHYPLPDWLWQPHVLAEAAILLRRFHDASVPMTTQRTGWQIPTHEPVEVICHNDFAPYNLVFLDGHVAGVIDFDTASPGPRIWDLAYLSYRLVPLTADSGKEAPAGSERILRLQALIKAYSAETDFGFTTSSLLITIAGRLQDLALFTDRRATETGNSDFAEHAAMYRQDSSAALLLAASN